MKLIFERILICLFGWLAPYWIRGRNGYEFPDDKKPLAGAACLTGLFLMIGILELQQYLTGTEKLYTAVTDISFGIIHLLITIILYIKKRKQVYTKEDRENHVITGWVISGVSFCTVIMMGLFLKWGMRDFIILDFFVYGLIGLISGVVIIIRSKYKIKNYRTRGEKRKS